MKTFAPLLLLALIAPPAFAAPPKFECEASAIKWVTVIASAPFVAEGESVLPEDLAILSRQSIGDGSEAYERFTIARTDSNEVYELTVDKEQINDVCPLEKFALSRR